MTFMVAALALVGLALFEWVLPLSTPARDAAGDADAHHADAMKNPTLPRV